MNRNKNLKNHFSVLDFDEKVVFVVSVANNLNFKSKLPIRLKFNNKNILLNNSKI